MVFKVVKGLMNSIRTRNTCQCPYVFVFLLFLLPCLIYVIVTTYIEHVDCLFITIITIFKVCCVYI